ncbi:pirin family protein [Kineococcus gynurae]|uniref:Pirin family protein n=1 Tax=Kineococcus gynurae TaxID=452979 RepID=A0ABV5LQX1_9ACTN
MIDRLPGRTVPLGGVRGMSVTRWLPHRGLPTVGPWCFLDRIGPQEVDMRVLPHPHTGLATVTWPLAGRIHHRDSLGTDVVVRPGELNLMTAGRGVSHSEFSLGERPLQHAVQLWLATPPETDDRPARFEQCRDLPVLDRPGLRAHVLLGTLDDVHSPATSPTPGALAAQVELAPGGRADLLLAPTDEHALLLLDGDAELEGQPLSTDDLHVLVPGRGGAALASHAGGRVLLIGGPPWREDLVMFWNFVGRSHEAVAAARADWEAQATSGDGRFGTVPGHGRAERIPAPPLPPVRLTPRRRAGHPGTEGRAAPPAMS